MTREFRNRTCEPRSHRQMRSQPVPQDENTGVDGRIIRDSRHDLNLRHQLKEHVWKLTPLAC